MKLSQALEEIGKTYQAVDNAISTYLSLGIDAGALAKGSKALLDIEGGRLSMEVERGRGHCHQIALIYETDLDRWFKPVFAPSDYYMVRQAFKD